ncbi:unnamed protein product [Dimorphilus gyrociliatus]|uniref:CBM21 domain-containing protein n=1 Tax=Dimorphilus gyrociliatus TaxID=2664684 RepID=A0A7I8VPK7_9ANNE|nr:unnamed protein product [Dimorphilus gyrociliatus]
MIKNGYNRKLSSSNSIDDEDEFGQRAIRKATYKRSSSEGAPKIPIDFQKTKSVRFADCLGLDLVYVREFCKSPPILRRVPSISDYCKMKEDFDSKFQCQFEQPSCQSNFYEKLHAQNVVLESIASEDQHLIVGFILCVNLAYKKNVGIRVTTNNWKTWEDSTANFYEDTRPSQFTDRFIFKIDPSTFKNGKKIVNLEFAVWYKVNGMEFWDNNSKKNYIIEVKF